MRNNNTTTKNNINNTCNNNNHSSSSSDTKNYQRSACCRFSSSSPSTTLLLAFAIPLIVVSVFVAVLGPKSPTFAFMSANYTKADRSSGVVGLKSNLDGNTVIIEEAIVSDESLVNRSSSPPLSVEPLSGASSSGAEQLNEKQENTLNITVNISPVNETRNASLNEKQENKLNISALNETHDVPLVRTRPFTHLDRLEGRLIRARSAISEAKIGNQSIDPEYIPIGPMYRSAKAFHRSYLEMEKEFKVFVYEEGEPPLFHNGPCKSIYSMEGNFIHEIEINPKFRTRDPNKAHVFFLPFSVTMLVRYVYIRDSHDFSPIRNTVIDYINVVSQKYPFWNRSLAADHFMLSCHDWGPEASKSNPNLQRNSIRVLCNANTSEGFNPMKDVSFPEINLLGGTMDKLLGGPSASRRPILSFFAGGVHGPIRPVLLEHWENKGDPEMRIHKYLPKGISYYDMLRRSKYCLCPSGYEVASPRVVEAIYTGCVPVLISDHYVPPFSDVLNWKSFSVSIRVEDIPNLKTILARISTSQYIRMQRRVLKVRRHFEVNSPPKRFDVFHMILHSVWLRRLNVRVN